MAKPKQDERFSNKEDNNVLKKAEKMIQRGKSSLVLLQVFYAPLLGKLRTIHDWNAGTGYTDGRIIGFNPNYIVSLKPEEVRAFLVHEVKHCAFGHHIRGKGKHHTKWNWATDYAINWIIDQLEGFSVMEGALLSSAYTNKMAEWIYNQLPEPPEGWDNAGGDQGGMGEVRQWTNEDGKKPSPAELKEEEGAWKTAVNQAYAVAKSAGKLPAGMDRWINKLLKPKVNVKALLICFLTEAIKGDFSWKSPNQRYMATTGIYLPSLQPMIAKLQKGAYIVDTSGSITQTDLQDVLTTIYEIIMYFDMELEVFSVDHELASHQTLDSFSDLSKVNFKGGGGTSFAPAFDYMEEKGTDPLFSIYFTDGYSSDYPKEKPDHPVLWLLHDGENESFAPPFGDVVRMDAE